MLHCSPPKSQMHAAGRGWRRASVECWVVGKRARTGKGATAELTAKVKGIVFKFKELKWNWVCYKFAFLHSSLTDQRQHKQGKSTDWFVPHTSHAAPIETRRSVQVDWQSGLPTCYHCWTIMSSLLFTAGSTSCTFWSFIRSAVYVPESGWSRRGIHVTPWVNQRDVQGSKASPLTRNQCSCKETEHTENVETPRQYTWINSC